MIEEERMSFSLLSFILVLRLTGELSRELEVGQGHFHFVRAFLPAESRDSQDVVEVREDDEVLLENDDISECSFFPFRFKIIQF